MEDRFGVEIEHASIPVGDYYYYPGSKKGRVRAVYTAEALEAILENEHYFK